jgi:hypothetical protein
MLRLKNGMGRVITTPRRFYNIVSGWRSEKAVRDAYRSAAIAKAWYPKGFCT